jgi:hypothetical protein
VSHSTSLVGFANPNEAVAAARNRLGIRTVEARHGRSVANGTDIDIPVLNRGCRPAGALCAILGSRAIAARELHAMGLVAAAYLDDELDHGTARSGRRSPPAPRTRLCDRSVDQSEPESGTLPRTSIGKPRQ